MLTVDRKDCFADAKQRECGSTDRDPVFEDNSEMISAYCDLCKTSTRGCEYYAKGRSRQHGKCLTCDKKIPRIPRGTTVNDPDYCYECDRARLVETTIRNG